MRNRIALIVLVLLLLPLNASYSEVYGKSYKKIEEIWDLVPDGTKIEIRP